MASKDNKFSQTGGGAMLTPNNEAQPSFDNRELHRQEMQRPTPTQDQEQNQEQGNDSEEPGNDGSDLDENKEEKEPLEKKVAKEGAKKALEAAGVPPGAANDIVKKADENGTLDKIVSTVKRRKLSIIASIVSALTPIIFWFVCFVGSIMLVLAGVAIIADKFSFIISLLTFDTEALGNYLNEIGTDVLSGKAIYQVYMTVALPNYGYVDKQTEGMSGDEETRTRNAEIEKVSQMIGAIMAPASYYDSNDSTTKKLTDIDLSDITKIPDEINEFFSQGQPYRIVAEDACMLAYAGLVDSTGKSYFEKYSTDYATAWNEVKNNECKDTQGLSSKIGVDTIIRSIISGVGSKPIGEIVGDALKDIYGNIITGEENKINKSLADNADDYSFNEATYKKFMEEYYGREFLDQVKDKPEDPDPIPLDEFNEGVVSLQPGLQNSAQDKLIEHYENLSGSGSGETLIDVLSPVYGESKCAVLEEYNPLTHEYVVSKSIDNDEIHSVSDGEVVEVIYNGENIYSKYDSKSGKCLCDGVECENSNGSQIKIKFTYDEVEYMAIYSNLAEIRVDVGDQVKKGDVIATEGNSGCTNTKKLTFKIISENGISYNVNEFIQKCSSVTNTATLCNFQNIKVNLHDCNNELIKTVSFYDYIKEETYKNFKDGINNEEFLKAATLITVTKALSDNNYMIGTTEMDVKNCSYKEVNINQDEYEKLDKAVSSVMGQVITYANKFANVKYSNTCTRTEKDKNANAVYNELCVTEAIKLDKTYKEILKIYYPNFNIKENYCNDYASKVNAYSIKNDKNYLISTSYSNEEIEKINKNLKNKIEDSKTGTRAATVEAARYLVLGLEYKIPYKNGGKYFEEGFNTNWYSEGLDSSGFVSWALKNGGANIEKGMTSNELISNNVVGNLKITAELYKYYDKIQVGDFAYNDSRIGIIIGKSDGILYVAEANSDMGLIVTKIASYGESDSKYTHIYFADDYYNGVGNITSMW